MSTTSEIMQRVYSSDGFKQKGYSLNLKDAFLVPISAHAYIVLLGWQMKEIDCSD